MATKPKTARSRILIATGNQDIIREFLPKVKFRVETKHTCTFTIASDDYGSFYSKVSEAGYNTYALLTDWN